MISKFLSSRFSGYIAIAGIIMVLALVWYIYNEGKTSCENSAKSAQLDNSIVVNRGAQEVKKEEQQMSLPEIRKSLCELGIARGNVGCDL